MGWAGSGLGNPSGFWLLYSEYRVFCPCGGTSRKPPYEISPFFQILEGGADSFKCGMRSAEGDQALTSSPTVGGASWPSSSFGKVLLDTPVTA